jgi:membrane-associated protease RseP (regulator of RpoE activity)
MLDIISFVVFITVLAFLVFKERKKVKREGILLMRRTKRGKKWMNERAKRHPKLWTAIAIAGVISAVPAMVFGVYFLGANFFSMLSGVATEGVRLVLPWPTAQTQLHPGVLLLPWWFWVIGVMSVIVPHELMHGIICRRENVRIKSLGWLLFLFIPGAFVEPDEKQLGKEKRLTKLKVYAAGSFANFVIAGLFLIVSSLFASTMFQVGLIPSGAVPGSPVANASVGGVLLAINDEMIDSPEKLSEVLDNIPPGTEIVLRTTVDNYTITTARHPEFNKSFIGISGPYYPYAVPVAGGGVTVFFRDLFMWIFILNLGIGIINMLPIKPLDGGHVFENLINKWTGKHTKVIVRVVSVAALLLLILNLVGPLMV